MSEVFRCDDKETLVAYLYGEVDTDVRREVERHLRSCAACTRETEGLQAVRQDLQAWLPPEPNLDIAIVSRSTPQLSAVPRRSTRWAALAEIPAWARVAAAALLIGVSAAIANVQVRSTDQGLVVTTGWMPARDADVRPAPLTTTQLAATSDEWRRELAALERTLREEMASQRIESRATPVRSSEPVDTAAVLRRVEAMIADSEERQRQEVAAKLIQADRMWNARRQADLLNVQRTLGTLQNRTFAVQATQQEAINQLRRVSLTPPNQ